jgi:hypothetical protein
MFKPSHAFTFLVLVLPASSLYAITPGLHEINDPLTAHHATAASSQAQSKSPTCSKKTLSGTYTYEFNGARDDGQILTREAGMEVYDGNGNLSVTASFNSVPGGVGSFKKAQLTYVVYPNCTGVLSGKQGPYADIFIDPTGDSFTFVSNVPGQQISGQEHRVSKKAIKQ